MPEITNKERIRLLFTSSSYRFEVMSKLGLLNKLNDETYLKKLFKYRMGYELNLKDPKTFNEKMQWLKIFDRNPIYTTMVDKYEAKKYVASIIGDEYIIPTLGVWDHFEDIDFDSLPNQFVLKCTHDSGGLVVCRDKSKLDIEAARKKINRSLKHNYFWYGREWPYKNVKPRILAERYMEDDLTRELRDYKFFCFGGIVKCFKVDFDRFIQHKANYYDSNGVIIKMGEKVCPPDFERIIVLPDNFELMKQLASSVSGGIPFMRADFYDVNGKVYFGELTFYPASGLGEFVYEENDKLLGSWLSIHK